MSVSGVLLMSLRVMSSMECKTAPGLGGNLGTTVECRTMCCVATIGVEKEKL